MSVLIITHKLREARKVADRLTVLRGGKSVVEGVLPDELDDPELIEAMVGRRLQPLPAERAATDAHARRARAARPDASAATTATGRRCASSTSPSPRARSSASPASRAAASASSSTRSPARATGTPRLRGRRHRASPLRPRHVAARGRRVRARGSGRRLGRARPTDRRAHRADGMRQAREPAKRAAPRDRLAAPPPPDRGARRRRAELRMAAMDRQVATLSGGNIQRVVLTLVLAGEAKLYVARLPDARARRRLVPARARARARLPRTAAPASSLVSEDLDELALLSDRIAVLHDGELAGIGDAGHRRAGDRPADARSGGMTSLDTPQVAAAPEPLRRRCARGSPGRTPAGSPAGTLFWIGIYLAALVIFGAFTALRGADPFAMYHAMWDSTVMNAYGRGQVLDKAAPFILAALAVTVPARAGPRQHRRRGPDRDRRDRRRRRRARARRPGERQRPRCC